MAEPRATPSIELNGLQLGEGRNAGGGVGRYHGRLDGMSGLWGGRGGGDVTW